MKSLTVLGNPLGKASYQKEVLRKDMPSIPQFHTKLKEAGAFPLTTKDVEILQVNLGKMCNQTCSHCHVDAGPDRKEIMTKEMMEACLAAVKASPSIHTIDMTGGAPEMNPNFQWFVEELSKLGRKTIVRSNLTILMANKKYKDYPEFFKKHGVTVIASLPCYTAENTDKQRGDGVFQKSIAALKRLNEVGYGVAGSGLELHLVYNPGGPSLPPNQASLEADYKKMLSEHFEIIFNNLYTITNLPISRFLDFLLKEGKYESYLEKLVDAFNPMSVPGLMCRNTISVGWDGQLYDCDFNQMLEMELTTPDVQHIRDFDNGKLKGRPIQVNRHCFGCTAGAGSSCQGSIA